MTAKQKKNLVRIIVSAALLAAIFAAEKITEKLGTPLNKYILAACCLAPYLISGWDVVWGCLRSIPKGRFLDEKFLMTVATAGAFAIGEYPEAVFVMVFYQTGELFQSIAVGRSRGSIAGLMSICPETARVERGGAEEEVFPEEVSVGETVIVLPGERIPLDGVVISGATDVDVSALTGESVPVTLAEGDRAYSGSVNLTGTVKIRTEKEYDDCTVSKILALIEDSSLNKAKTEVTLTRFARIYTPVVVGLAALTALIGSLVTRDPATWIYQALVCLVVSCPCAIVISVPLAYFGGVGGASSKGILVKGSAYLEALGRADVFVFDKTGTLTRGEFAVTGVLPAEGHTAEDVLYYAAAAESRSTHPIALSVVRAAGGNVPVPESSENLPGSGVRAVLGGREILVGRPAMMAERGICADAVRSDAAVCVAVDGEYYGEIALDDEVRAEAKQALDALRALGVSKTVMLTGDGEAKARRVGEALGVDEIHSGLLPDDKVRRLAELVEGKTGGAVAYVGDGINDAPVLARADVGVAMGGVGSDAAIEAADAVIMEDSLAKLPLAVRIARKTARIVRENIVFALAVKAVVLIFAFLGLSNMWAGVLADVGVAVLCILNAMRALKIKK